jgi:hypothetical protein
MNYFDRQGNPITMDQWPTGGDRRVALTEIGNLTVSTVHLVLEHGFGQGPPVIFETMIFGGGTHRDLWQMRYCTEAEAFTGHNATVAWLKGEGPEPQ